MGHGLPTDREILECIYNLYLPSFPGNLKEDGKHENDPYLPIDLARVGSALGCSKHLIFGRLHYSLRRTYSYKIGHGLVDLFAPYVGGRSHCVNFPYLVSVLADSQNTHRREQWSLWLSAVSLVIAIAAILVQVLR